MVAPISVILAGVCGAYGVLGALQERSRTGVRSIDEVCAWDQTASQGPLVDVEHSTLGTLTLPGPPLRFLEADGEETTGTEHGAPPTLGEHDESIRGWLQGDR